MKNQLWVFVALVVTLQEGFNFAYANAANEGVKAVPPTGRTNNYIRETGDIAPKMPSHLQQQPQQQQLQRQQQQQPPQQHLSQSQGYPAQISGSGVQIDHKNSYNLLSEAMTQAVSNEFSNLGSGSADGACHVDDMDCFNSQDRLSMEAIRALHKQLDDDDNGNIDLSESDDFLREELKYDSGYEKRQKAFHFNDDMHISVKELWEAWLRSEVHNWTIEQTTDWLAQSVQLPQYVEVFKIHKVTGAALPRLAVNTMHYLSNVLGIKDPIHKQKIALKAMDVVLFGPPRETGARWKDYILVALLLSAIIGCWYAYQQNKNAKIHLRRMAQDMEGLQRAEQSLQEMQKELERARMEQENVASEKMDLERRLKEAPALTSSSSDLEVQQLKKEIEMLRSELSRAEIELVDNCWAPPPQLQQWLQYTYELESKNHQKKRASAERQLQSAREACEKLRKKRTSFVGAFVSTHGKSIDDVDRSIVEARNALSEVTNELQERLHRWKQIETCLGFNIVNNNGLPYLESVLYSGRNGAASKGSRGRITSSTDDLDEDSIQGIFDNYSRSSGMSSGSGILNSGSNALRDDSSCSDEGTDVQSVHFYLGSAPTPPAIITVPQISNRVGLLSENAFNHIGLPSTPQTAPILGGLTNASPLIPPYNILTNNDSNLHAEENGSRDNASISSECSVTAPPRLKKQAHVTSNAFPVQNQTTSSSGRAPLPPPRKSNQNPLLRSQSTDMMVVPVELQTYFPKIQSQRINKPSLHQSSTLPTGNSGATTLIYQPSTAATNPLSLSIPQTQPLLSVNKPSSTLGRIGKKLMVKQHSTASQQSSSSTSSSVQSAPPTMENNENLNEATSQDGAVSPKKSSTELDIIVPSRQNSDAFIEIQATNISKALESLNNLTNSFKDTEKLLKSSHGSTQSINSLTNSEKDKNLESSSSNSESGSKKRKRRLRFPFSGHNSNSNKNSNTNSNKELSLKNKNKKDIT